MAPKAGTAPAPANPTGRVQGEPPAEIPRDRWGRPLIAPPDGRGRAKAYTRASTLGGTLEDQYGLGQWRMRQVAFGLARRRDLVLAAAAVPTSDTPEDKTTLAEIAEAALEAAESSAKATIGTAIHALTERIDRGEPIPDIGEDMRTLEAYRERMRDVTVHASETFVVHDVLECAGTFDRLITPRGKMVAPDGTVYGPDGPPLIMDLKTSGTSDYFGIKFCVQLAVYAGGVPYTHDGGRGLWPDTAPSDRWGLILHLPSGGDLAEWHWVDLERGHELAQLAVAVRDWRKRKDLVVPAVPPNRPEIHAVAAAPKAPEPVADPDPLLRSIATAASEDELEDLWEQNEEIWTDAHTAAANQRLAELGTGAG